jgi:hypothetical protein
VAPMDSEGFDMNTAETSGTKSDKRQTIAYIRDGVLILGLALGGMYVLAHPEKFDAFMNWTIGHHYRS